MKRIRNKKFGIFVMFALVLVGAFFIMDNLKDTKAATGDVWIEIDGKPYSASDTYDLQKNITTITLATNDIVYESNSQYSINWVITDNPTVHVADIATTNPYPTKMTCNVEAKSVGTVKLTVNIVAGGSVVKSSECNLRVGFVIDKSDTSFDKVYPADPNYSMILRLPSDDALETTSEGSTGVLKPIFPAPGTTYVSDNADVVACTSSGTYTAKGAGSAKITATYSEVKGGTVVKYTDTINVYVLPRVSKDDSVYEKTIPAGSFKVQNLKPIYVDTVFGSNQLVSQGEKIIWVIKKQVGADYTVIADSLGKTSSLAKLIPSGANSNQYTIDAKAGTYRIEFWTVGTYKSETEKINALPAVADVTVYASLKDLTINLVAGDSYNIADAFNIDIETFNNLFTMGDISNEDKVYIDYNDTNSVVSSNGIKGTAEITLKHITSPFNTSTQILDLYEHDSSVTKSDFTITINILDSFTLSQSKAIMYVNATMDLDIVSSYIGGTVKWTSSNTAFATVDQEGKIKALKATDTTDTNKENDSVTITATLTMTNGTIKKATCVIAIVPTIENLTLNKTELNLPVGESSMITANFTPTNSTANLIWVSSEEDIVDYTVSTDTRSIEVTGKKIGSTVIFVMNDKNMIYATCKITVSDTVTSITLSQAQLTVKKSQEYVRLKATYTPSDAKPSLLWKSSNTSVATVDDEGLVTLVAAGQAIITVQPALNPNFIMAQCNLTVQESSRGITLSKSTTTLEAGKTETLKYVLTPSNATTKVTWKSLDTTVASVNDEGVVSAKAAGKTTIIATTDEGFNASCTIIVTQAATGFTLDVYDLTLGVGDVYHVLAVPTPAGSTETTFTWTSKDPTIASVTDGGKVTGVSAGSTVILVKTKSGKVDYLYVTVKDNIKSMTLNYATKSVTMNSTFTLKPVFSPSKPTNTNVTWKSSNSKIASVSTKGVVKGLKGGTAIITCTAEDGGYVATCIVTVKELTTSLTLNKSSYSLGIGKTVTLKATIKTNSSTNQVLRWTSSNTSVATVNSKGKVTARRLGKCTIRVKATDGSGEQDTCTIYVVRAATSLRLNRAYITVVEGRSAKLYATIKPSNATYKTPSWSSSNKDIAIVDSSGRITGLAVGTATVKAVTRDNSNKSAYCVVKVIKEVSASSVTVSSKDMTLIKGQTGTVSVSVQPSNTTDSVTYASDNRAVATVTNTGKVTARKSGIATITITTTSGKQATVNVTVVGLNKTSVSMTQYDTETIWVEGATQVSWFSANPSIATVDSNGKIVAKKAGTTTIYATVNGIRLACTVRVSNMN